MSKKKEQVVEYTIRMLKSESDKLVQLSEAKGEDNELVYLEEHVRSWIKRSKVKS